MERQENLMTIEEYKLKIKELKKNIIIFSKSQTKQKMIM